MMYVAGAVTVLVLAALFGLIGWRLASVRWASHVARIYMKKPTQYRHDEAQLVRDTMGEMMRSDVLRDLDDHESNER